ncbi:MAG: hypothetical protein IPF99_31895 [Deltaproteobacteria bacterium]|nr:hypothetical protein [Deltaproteobacteria bacterium]
MTPPSFWYIGERVLFRQLAALRLRAGSWDAAAARLVADLAAAAPHEAPELHLFFEARCAQACEFCEAPAVRDRPLPRAVVTAPPSRPGDRRPAEHRSLRGPAHRLRAQCAPRRPLDHRLRLAAAPRARCDPRCAGAPPRAVQAAQGPSTALSDPALARRVAALSGLRAVALTLQASDPAAPDAMVGRAGSFHEVKRAIEQLHEAGATVEISTVLTRDAVTHLPQTLTWLATRRWKTWLSAFMPDRDLPAPEPLHPTIARLRETLADHERATDAAVLSFVGVALCAVPARLRDRAFGAPLSHGGNAVSVPACDRCAMRPRCPGVSTSYLRAHGDGDLIPLGARPA